MVHKVNIRLMINTEEFSGFFLLFLLLVIKEDNITAVAKLRVCALLVD